MLQLFSTVWGLLSSFWSRSDLRFRNAADNLKCKLDHKKKNHHGNMIICTDKTPELNTHSSIRFGSFWARLSGWEEERAEIICKSDRNINYLLTVVSYGELIGFLNFVKWSWVTITQQNNSDVWHRKTSVNTSVVSEFLFMYSLSRNCRPSSFSSSTGKLFRFL